MMCFGLKERKRTKTNHCVIVLLDDTQLVHELHPTSSGQDLLDVVIKHLNLLETSYFGLRYLEPVSSESHKVEPIWLDVSKSAIKQLRNVNPMTVYFGIKYYASDPCKLAEEITRYQFFLQCKQDILHARLPVPFELSVELFALAVQSELGDYDPQRHQSGYVSEFQFLPNQTLELEERAALYHRNLTGQVPASAELNFLERVKWLDLYGSELHPIQYEDNGEEYALGLNPNGVLVLRNRLKVAQYLWSRIIKTKCQGRCFLMHVIDNKQTQSTSSPSYSRFGFRLANKESARRLRWAIEDHKSFHHLIHDSATLNQLARRQQQQNFNQLSQKFRNSIRSAIGIGAGQQTSAALSNIQIQQRLRSSMKSLGNQQYASLETSRAQPTVVRMPSRRYSNRSLGRVPFNLQAANANGNGLPYSAGSAMTMGSSAQRQQALMIMNQMNMAGKSHTLKPIPSSAKGNPKDAKRNPYYQMMMMMASQQHYQATGIPEVSILPPGRHLVQPSIYKSSSVVNGMDRLGNTKDERPFNLRSQQQYYGQQAGSESPKSTKSAIGPSNALKLASKRLMKQQQILYGNQSDVQPLLAHEANNRMLTNQQQKMYLIPNADYYQQQQSYNMSTSANVSPRSIRSNRISSNARHKSKSTNENLHLLQDQIYANKPIDSRSLLATANQMIMPRELPPPDYQSSSRSGKQRLLICPDDSELTEMSKANQIAKQRRQNFAINADQANLLLQANLELKAKENSHRIKAKSDKFCEDPDDYCCSRSDCSSIDTGDYGNFSSNKRNRKSVTADAETGQWNAIRKRHNEFNNGKGFLNGNSFPGKPQVNSQRDQVMQYQRQQHQQQHQQQTDANNNLIAKVNTNNNNSSQLVKNIANKQATPILLSMNYEQSNQVNNKAVQLLNLQRQQLNSQSSDGGTKSSSSVLDSTPSSVASSPKGTGAMTNMSSSQKHRLATPPTGVKPKTSDSTASSSTTSGYYAASNSAGSSGSADSDNQMPTDDKRSAKTNNSRSGFLSGAYNGEWRDEGTRAKIAIGQYGPRGANLQRIQGDQQLNQFKGQDSRMQRSNQKQQFYLGENMTSDDQNSTSSQQHRQDQWCQIDQMQQHPQSSLKYVSFDV